MGNQPDLDRIQRAIAKVPDPDLRALLEREVVAALVSGECLDAALAVARSIGSNPDDTYVWSERAEALGRMAVALKRRGRASEAAQVLRTAIDSALAATIPGRTDDLPALRDLVEFLAFRLGATEDAETVAAAHPLESGRQSLAAHIADRSAFVDDIDFIEVDDTNAQEFDLEALCASVVFSDRLIAVQVRARRTLRNVPRDALDRHVASLRREADGASDALAGALLELEAFWLQQI